jgi:hypothetical protein
MATVIATAFATPAPAKQVLTTKTAMVKVMQHINDSQSIICKWNNKDTLRVRVVGIKPTINTEIQITYKHSKESGCPKNASYHEPKTQSQSSTTVAETETAATIEEWEAEGGITLSNGESVFVKGTRETYKVSRARQGNAVFCGCAAWKFQKANPLCRSCKHTIAVCGKMNESLRVAVATVALLSAKKEPIAKPALPSLTNTRRPGASKTITAE